MCGDLASHTRFLRALRLPVAVEDLIVHSDHLPLRNDIAARGARALAGWKTGGQCKFPAHVTLRTHDF